MAADILLYNTTHVPVGDDQKQHLELTRDIAQKFNNDLNCEGLLTIPEPLIQKEFSRIMSLKNGKNKMSKSDPSEQSRINLKDEKDVIAQKIKKAKTDSLPIPVNKSELQSRPEAENLLSIYCSLSGDNLEKVLKEFGGKNFSFLKEKLIELLINKICPIGVEIKKLMNDEKFLLNVLKEGNLKANSIANNNLNKIYDKVGLLKFSN
jgi:tryptophanyl-tRNA synthetase